MVRYKIGRQWLINRISDSVVFCAFLEKKTALKIGVQAKVSKHICWVVDHAGRWSVLLIPFMASLSVIWSRCHHVCFSRNPNVSFANNDATWIVGSQALYETIIHTHESKPGRTHTRSRSVENPKLAKLRAAESCEWCCAVDRAVTAPSGLRQPQ